MARPEFTDRQKLLVYQHFNGECQDCHLKLDANWHDGGTSIKPKQTFTIYGAEIHHIIPIADGGVHKISNWELLCVLCHHKKTFIKRLLKNLVQTLIMGINYAQRR